MNAKLDYKQGYKAFTGLFTREILEAVLPYLLLVLLALSNMHVHHLADLGRPDEIGKLFSGFQKYLYQPTAVA